MRHDDAAVQLQHVNRGKRRVGILLHVFQGQVEEYALCFQKGTYDKQRDRLREEITVAELELYDVRTGAIDVETVLGFAEQLLSNAARLWFEGTLEQRRALQHAIFPEGLPFDGRNLEPPQHA